MITSTPLSFSANAAYVPTSDVVSADPDIVKYSTSVLPPEIIADLVLQDIGGIEFSMIVRQNGVTGKSVSDQIITNLTLLNAKFNPVSLGGSSGVSRRSQNAMTLEEFLPPDSTVPVVYRDLDVIIINVNNVPVGYVVEVDVESVVESKAVDLSP